MLLEQLRNFEVPKSINKLNYESGEVKYSDLKKLATEFKIDLLDVARLFKKKGNIIEEEYKQSGDKGVVKASYFYVLFGMYAHREMNKKP